MQDALATTTADFTVKITGLPAAEPAGGGLATRLQETKAFLEGVAKQEAGGQGPAPAVVELTAALKQAKLLKLYEERGGLYRELLKVRPPRRAAAVSGSAVSDAGRCAADGVKKARRGH
jgi:hypothetical protein